MRQSKLAGINLRVYLDNKINKVGDTVKSFMALMKKIKAYVIIGGIALVFILILVLFLVGALMDIVVYSRTLGTLYPKIVNEPLKPSFTILNEYAGENLFEVGQLATGRHMTSNNKNVYSMGYGQVLEVVDYPTNNILCNGTNYKLPSGMDPEDERRYGAYVKIGYDTNIDGQHDIVIIYSHIKCGSIKVTAGNQVSGATDNNFSNATIIGEIGKSGYGYSKNIEHLYLEIYEKLPDEDEFRAIDPRPIFQGLISSYFPIASPCLQAKVYEGSIINLGTSGTERGYGNPYEITVTEYVMGTIASEMGSGAPYQAQKAQAVASRSLLYGSSFYDTKTKELKDDIVSNSSNFQNSQKMCQGMSDTTMYNRLWKAANETAFEVIKNRANKIMYTEYATYTDRELNKSNFCERTFMGTGHITNDPREPYECGYARCRVSGYRNPLPGQDYAVCPGDKPILKPCTDSNGQMTMCEYENPDPDKKVHTHNRGMSHLGVLTWTRNDPDIDYQEILTYYYGSASVDIETNLTWYGEMSEIGIVPTIYNADGTPFGPDLSGYEGTGMGVAMAALWAAALNEQFNFQKIPYYWGGSGWNQIGANPRWGEQGTCRTSVAADGSPGQTRCAIGEDCGTFISWVSIQAGFNGRNDYWDGTTVPLDASNYDAIAPTLKEGDIVYLNKLLDGTSFNHVGVIVGTDPNGEVLVGHSAGGTTPYLQASGTYAERHVNGVGVVVSSLRKEVTAGHFKRVFPCKY